MWADYQNKGVWGLWRASLGVSFALGVEYEGRCRVFSAEGVVGSAAALPDGFVFEWRSRHGLRVLLYADSAPTPAESDFWVVLLEYEAFLFDRFPSFMPFLPGVGAVGFDADALLARPPALLLLNGQPGTGKQAILQTLALRHAARKIPEAPLVEVQIASVSCFVVPEVAMLELNEQQAVIQHAKSGGNIWAASVYDLQALRNRKIIQPALVDLLIPGRLLLPPLAKRAPEDLEEMAAFWRAFHGLGASGAEANLDFFKGRTLGKGALSVESILEEGRGLRGVIAEFEKQAILKAQARVGRSQHKIANLLKVSRGSLQHKLRKYQLESYAPGDADTENEG